MRTVNEKLEGPLTIEQDLCLNGMIAGDARVASGIRFEMNGMVTGDLTIEAGAEVALRGTLSGALVNYGRCDVWGVVSGPIYDEKRGETTLHPGAVHKSGTSA